MPASPERLQREKNIKETPKNAGLTLTITLTAYDNGLLELDTKPVGDHKADSDARRWMSVAMVISQKLRDFQHEAEKRQAEKGSGS